MAKLASRRAKPDGVVVVPPDEVTSFLHPLAVEELWGVGEKTAAQLHRLGLMTVGDVAHTPLPILHRALGPALGGHLHDLAWGIDDRVVVARRGGFFGAEPEKSMGHDETFGRDTDDPEVIRRELLRLSSKVAARMRTRAGGRAHRDAAGAVRRLHHDHPLPDPGRGDRRDPGDLPDRGRPLRARSVCSGPGSGWSGCGWRDCPRAAAAYRQLVLGGREHGWSEADQAVDRALLRFGGKAVQPAALLGGGRP